MTPPPVALPPISMASPGVSRKVLSLIVIFALEKIQTAPSVGSCEPWNAWIPERSATGLREADLNVLSKLGNQGLEGRLEPEAFTGGEVGREDDLLDFLVGCPVYI